MNTNITSLQTIVDVLQSNDFITGIVEIKKDGEVVGYTITFGKHDPITIYHGQDGQDGADGKDGQDGQNGSTNAPVIGVAQDTDGVYYWTLNGEWLLDDNGNKLPVSGKDGQNGTNGSNGQDGADGKDGQDGADGQDGKDGITPQLKIEDGYWYVSYDNGTTWIQLGKATGEDGKDGVDGEDGKDGQNGADGKDGQDGDSMFQSVTQDENYVYFTLADGTVIKIAKGSSNDQPNSEFIFTITYDPNGGDGVMPIDTFYYGMTKNLKNCEYTKKGHRFIGWNSNVNGTGASYTDSHQVTIDKNITLYAQWQEYEAIDLGLSVLWAAFDVGATSPDEIGHLFAWGEVEPKEQSQFTWSTYKFGGYSQLTKYCTEGAYGVLDNKVTLDLEDDAANVHWGGDWRMPTVEEVTELIEKCKWSGHVYASGNGNSIHFPVYGHSCFYPSYGYYRAWTSSLSQSRSSYAEAFSTNTDIYTKLNSIERYLYCFIRPVKDKK
jgi:uncharacterized repeat protein (TIGR02543 family)